MYKTLIVFAVALSAAHAGSRGGCNPCETSQVIQTTFKVNNGGHGLQQKVFSVMRDVYKTTPGLYQALGMELADAGTNSYDLAQNRCFDSRMKDATVNLPSGPATIAVHMTGEVKGPFLVNRICFCESSDPTFCNGLARSVESRVNDIACNLDGKVGPNCTPMEQKRAAFLDRFV